MSRPTSRIVYVNGDYLAEEAAKISVFDRGFLFADAVYEVTSVLDGRMLDFEGHMRRLHRSLGELDIAAPAEDAAIEAIHRELMARNALTEGLIYLQVSRGAADRDFLYPAEAVPSLVLFTQEKKLRASPAAQKGLKVIAVPDIRWARCDIKTVQLLAPSMCKMVAKKAGADDAWMIEEGGLVTEGSSNNAHIVTRDGTIVTRDLSNAILHGITRAAVLRCAEEAQMRVEERPFHRDEVTEAAEAFITSASSFVTPVVAFDGQPIGDGTPGPVTRRLREIYIETALARAS